LLRQPFSSRVTSHERVIPQALALSRQQGKLRIGPQRSLADGPEPSSEGSPGKRS
jgi:hypothetical protein